MKTSTGLLLWALFWIALGGAGFFTGNDTAFIVGLVSSTVYVVGSHLARLLENNKKEND